MFFIKFKIGIQFLRFSRMPHNVSATVVVDFKYLNFKLNTKLLQKTKFRIKHQKQQLSIMHYCLHRVLNSIVEFKSD